MAAIEAWSLASARRVSASVRAASSASVAHSTQAQENSPCSTSSPTSRGPATAPTNSPDSITPTAQAGLSGLRWTTAKLRPPGHAQPRLPARSAATTITPGSPAISSR
jgi:hypothetical protein